MFLELFPMMEKYALLQKKCVFFPVLRNHPIFCQGWRDFQIFIQPDQAVIKLFGKEYVGIGLHRVELHAERVGNRFYPENAAGHRLFVPLSLSEVLENEKR